MDYALLGIGIALLVALGWVVTALYDLKDRATYATDHMNAIQRQIAAIPTPDAPDLSALNAIHEKRIGRHQSTPGSARQTRRGAHTQT
jgi:hypothetical protein